MIEPDDICRRKSGGPKLVAYDKRMRAESTGAICIEHEIQCYEADQIIDGLGEGKPLEDVVAHEGKPIKLEWIPENDLYRIVDLTKVRDARTDQSVPMQEALHNILRMTEVPDDPLVSSPQEETTQLAAIAQALNAQTGVASQQLAVSSQLLELQLRQEERNKLAFRMQAQTQEQARQIGVAMQALGVSLGHADWAERKFIDLVFEAAQKLQAARVPETKVDPAYDSGLPMGER